jgi:hypothetical protein
MITALELTRRETLLLGTAAFASTIARPALAQKGSERHGMSAFGDLKYPAGFKHFDYVNPNAPKGGLFSQVGASRSFNLNFLTFNSLNIFGSRRPQERGRGSVSDGRCLRSPVLPSRQGAKGSHIRCSLGAVKRRCQCNPCVPPLDRRTVSHFRVSY